MFENIIGDIKAYNLRYPHVSLFKKIFYLCFAQEFIAVLVYRFGHWASYHCNFPVIKNDGFFKIQ